MKKIIGLALCFLFLTMVQAQSEIFAGGEIFVEYAGDGTEECGDPVPYHITLKFSRDQQSPANPPDEEKTVTIKDASLKVDPGQFTVDLTDITYDISRIPILCLSNIPVETESRWYRTLTPVLIPGNIRAQVSYANLMNSAFGRNFHSPENYNITTGQRFFIKTSISTQCDILITGSNDRQPLKMVVDNQRFTSSVNWVAKDIVETFCDGKPYEYDFKQLIDKSGNFYQVDTVLLRDTVRHDTLFIGPDTVIAPDQYTLIRASIIPTGGIFKRENIQRGDTLITGMPVKLGVRIVREERIIPISSAKLNNIRTVQNLQIVRKDSVISATDTMVTNQTINRQDISDLLFEDDGSLNDSLKRTFFIQRVDRVGTTIISDTSVTRDWIKIFGEELEERVVVKLVSLQRDDGRPVAYEPGFSGSYQFPTTFSGVPSLNNAFNFPSNPLQDPPNFIVVDNVLRFTPQLPLGTNEFTAAVGFRIEKYREIPRKSAPVNGVSGFERNNFVSVSTTFRQMRFVFGNRCNDRLPDFNSTTPFSTNTNGDVTAWEFNCAETALEFTMTEPMLANTLIGNGTEFDNNNNGRLEFRIFRGTESQTLDDDPIAIDSVIPGSINNLGEFSSFTVYLYEPIGPGTYTMFTKLGTDGNTLKNRCGFALAEDSMTTFVVNTNYDYDYYTDRERFCFPADTANNMFFNANRGLSPEEVAKAIRFEYAYRGTNILAPEQFRDAFYDKEAYKYRLDTSFTVPPDYPLTPITDFKEGFWNIGVGLDFSYTYNEVYYPAVCFGEDTVYAEFLVNPAVTFEDIDLCANEEWPIIKGDIDYTNSNVALQNVSWGAGQLSASVGTKDGYEGVNFRPVGGQSNDNTLNDSLDIGSFAFGLGNSFAIRSITEFDNGCVDTSLFTAVRQEVLVEIGNDSLICPNEQYFLESMLDSTYLIPDSMSYQWYYNNVAVTDADSSTFLIEDEGWYKLVVTKRTKNGSCFGEDSVRIRIADSLAAPKPICAFVDFEEGILVQDFYIPPVPGADFFEARGVDALGNYVNNGTWEEVTGLEFSIDGPEIMLEVRGVNLEVDTNSICRYGPVGIAEACEIVVKPVNIFTPNGDGINDVLKFHLIEAFPGSSLKIFNRWGRLIYETENYLNDWDGKDYKDGTYFYILDVNDPDNIQDIFKGSFTIVR